VLEEVQVTLGFQYLCKPLLPWMVIPERKEKENSLLNGNKFIHIYIRHLVPLPELPLLEL